MIIINSVDTLIRNIALLLMTTITRHRKAAKFFPAGYGYRVGVTDE